MDDVELAQLSELPLLAAKGLSFLPEFLVLDIDLCVSSALAVEHKAPLAVESGAGGIGGMASDLLLSGIIWPGILEECSCWQATV